jgi:hypothetical protein
MYNPIVLLNKLFSLWCHHRIHLPVLKPTFLVMEICSGFAAVYHLNDQVQVE